MTSITSPRTTPVRIPINPFTHYAKNIIDKSGVADVLEIKNVLTSEQCDEIINFYKHHLEPAKNPVPWILQTSYHTYNLPSGIMLDEILEPVWEYARDHFQIHIEATEQYQVKRYNQGDFLTHHQDQLYGTCKPYERKLTMVIQLSDENDYTDGNLRIIKSFNADRTKGSLIIIPSYYLHEVTPITSGERWSLSNWAWGNFWK